MKLLAAVLKLGFGGQIPRNEQCCLLECLTVDMQIAAALQSVFHANKKKTSQRENQTYYLSIKYSTYQKGENAKLLNIVY